MKQTLLPALLSMLFSAPALAHHVWNYTDKQPGERKGERYDMASYVTALSFTR